MLAKVASAALVGVDARPVEVEVKVQGAFPGFHTVGLPELSVREARVRVRSAIRHSGIRFPARQIIVNLAPADLRKEGTYYDLPVALGILACCEVLDQDALDGWVVIGELSLAGEIRPVRGVLAIAEMARAAGMKGVICSLENAPEVAVVEGVDVRSAATLGDVVEAMQFGGWPEPDTGSRIPVVRGELCWSDVRGQEAAKRALEVAAAGGHNVVMAGTPGTGKTMLARRLPTILPPMAPEEALTATKVWSVAGLLPCGAGLMHQRPFRAPHHTGSACSLVGGGSSPRPGEVSLAHGGVLFLDELLEFPRSVLETLRQPLEDGHITIARTRQVVCFPARFMLVAALNPCPCGFRGSKQHACRCSSAALERYRGRLSGPVLDRIDIQVELDPLPPRFLRDGALGESSSVIRERVLQARQVQARRYADLGGGSNASVVMSQMRARCPLAGNVHDLLLGALEHFGLSPRAHDRIWRVARTIADLGQREDIDQSHVAEALQYRHFDEPVATG